MTTETPEGSTAAQTGVDASAKDDKNGMGDRHIHRDDMRKIWIECQSESFWYRALPLSVTSMAVTGALIYQALGYGKHRNYFPKLALAGIVGFAVGKESYAGTCRKKFERLGPYFGPPGFGPNFGPWSQKPDFAPGHRHCHHVCEQCKKQQAQTVAPAEVQPAQS